MNIENYIPSQPAHDKQDDLSSKVFSDPQDFLNTMRTHFSELSHGHDTLTLVDVELDSADNHLDPKTRAAASIAAEHFNDLAGIHRQGEGANAINSDPAGGISMDDLDFAADMNNHNTFGYAASNVANDALSAAGGGIAALFGAGTLMTVGLESNLMAVGGIGIGAFGVGMAGYGIYETFIENQRIKQYADTDSAKFKSWISL